MDISRASNFERFVFDLHGQSGERTRELFKAQLGEKGVFKVASEVFDAIPAFGFVSGRSTHADRVATIRDAWQRFDQMIDPHTADGLKVGREHRDAGVPMIVLETALPAKFASTLVEATGREPDRPAATRGIEALPRRFTVIAADAKQVQDYIAAHTGAA
jgi:threonine synthase